MQFSSFTVYGKEYVNTCDTSKPGEPCLKDNKIWTRCDDGYLKQISTYTEDIAGFGGFGKIYTEKDLDGWKDQAKKEYENIKAEKQINTKELDTRESTFGSSVKNLMSVSIQIGNYKFSFGELENSFKKFIEIKNIKEWKIGEINLYNDVFKNGVYTAFSAVSTSLCVLFLMVGVIKDALAFDHLDWRRVIAQILKTCVVIYFVNNSWSLLEKIGEVVEAITNDAMQLININMGGSSLGVAGLFHNIMVWAHHSTGTGIFSGMMGSLMEILYLLITLIIAIFYYKSLLEVVYLVFQRLFKLMFAFSVSPLPFALTLSEGNNGQGIFRYAIWVAGILLEGLLMLVAVRIYLALWSGLMSGIHGTEDAWCLIGILFVGSIFINGVFKIIIEAGQNVIQQFAR